MIKTRNLFPLFLVFTFITSSCALETSTVFKQSVCSPPCWNGIVPGHTGSIEGIEILAGVPEINQSTLASHEHNDGRGYHAWLFNSSVAQFSGRAYFDKDGIYVVDLWLDNPITLKRFVEELGEPGLVSPISGWADSKYILITILYPEKGIALTSFDPWFWPDRPFVKVKPNLRIEDIYFFEPSAFFEPDTYYEIYSLASDDETIQESLQEWSGYGDYTYAEWGE